MRFEGVTPILRSFDEAKAKEFYVGFLGFSVAWEHRFEDGLPLYCQVEHGDVALHLSEHHGDSCPGSTGRIGVTDLQSFRDQLVSKAYAYARPGIEDTPWGTREMKITDPFGNRLIFVAMEES